MRHRLHAAAIALYPSNRQDRCRLRRRGTAFARDICGLTPAAEQALLDHPWPGNVRELRNCVERAVALSHSQWIGSEALFSPGKVEPEAVASPSSTLEEVRRRAERQHIRAVLTRAGGRVEDAAKLLGVSRSTLFEKIRKLDMRADL